MFEDDFCLTCGKGSVRPGHAYCSSACEAVDSASSVSSAASSTFSSPHLKSTPASGQPPALTISSSLTASAQGRSNRYSISSSASSTSYSATDDDEESLVDPEVNNDLNIHKHTDAQNESSSFSLSPGMFFARRPSSTNNHSMLPVLQRPSLASYRPYASSPSGIPKSAPHHSIHDRAVYPLGKSGGSRQKLSSGSKADDHDRYCHSAANADGSHYDRSPRHRHRTEAKPHEGDEEDLSSTITSPSSAKRSRNRASLPSYFSLMNINGQHSNSVKSPPAPPCSSVPRASPSTPKTAGFVSSSLRLSATSLAPRGRGSRESDGNEPIRSFQNSPAHRGSLNIRPEGGQRRGRTLERQCDRSSARHIPDVSPQRPPLTTSVPHRITPESRGVSGISSMMASSPSNHRRGRVRGRARGECLDGAGNTVDAPGLGNGRSGLLHRERPPPPESMAAL
ncbi:hypothetical protein BDV98DRAFT_410503 [Pterulicium gracile]|uniref:Uncharacterized protein n=1 Tax=Pterulicium gracile TaxID=1884261 RepID=A0A5C3QLR1_9AGAR|nr:hypothetical protein BDV98DRAFT_410503 [Pterula gracilis]